MLFATNVVCKQAFYQLYGFGKTLFFEYQKRYESGARVGFHWGNRNRKSSECVLLCIGFMRQILEKAAEPLPHIDYKGSHGTDTLTYKLPACSTKESIFKEVKCLMEASSITPVSLNTFYAIWRKNFENFSIYQTSAFAICLLCASLRERLSKEWRPDAKDELQNERDNHLNVALSRKSQYYSNHTAAMVEPHRFLSIIHDKMDQAKTGIPRLVELNKSFATGCLPLPFALTGMLMHGRDPGAFGHFSLNGLWPSDPNFTITSLAKCLRDLEDWHGDYSGDLSIPLRSFPSSPLLKALVDPKAFITGYLEPNKLSEQHFCSNIHKPRGIGPALGSFTSLPRNLLLQLDNSRKDNKNKPMLAFCSHLVARGVFETVMVSFLMVGHTHEDVDALFGKVSCELRQKEVQTLHGLMASFWGCLESCPVPSLIQEVVDYKSFIEGCLNRMQGHFVPIQFLFSMKNNVPVFQYKEKVDGIWLPIGGQPIWEVDQSTQKLKIPCGDPKPVPISNTLRKLPEVIAFTKKYIDWKTDNAKDITSEAFSLIQPLKSHWERILEILQGDFNTRSEAPKSNDNIAQVHQDMHSTPMCELQCGFWPNTNHGTGYKENFSEELTIHVHPLEQKQVEEDLVAEQIFVGDLAIRPQRRFVPLKHIQANEFVIIRPADDFELENPNCIWLGRALSIIDMDKDSAQHGKFQVEWWRPESKCKQPITDEKRYKNCLVPSRYWEKDPYFSESIGPQYIGGSATIYSWTPRVSHPKLRLMLPTLAQTAIKEHFICLSNIDMI